MLFERSLRGYGAIDVPECCIKLVLTHICVVLRLWTSAHRLYVCYAHVSLKVLRFDFGRFIGSRSGGRSHVRTKGGMKTSEYYSSNTSSMLTGGIMGVPFCGRNQGSFWTFRVPTQMIASLSNRTYLSKQMTLLSMHVLAGVWSTITHVFHACFCLPWLTIR